MLAIAIDSRGFSFLLRGLQKHFEELWRCRIVMLPITEKFVQLLLEEPVKIADPVQPVRMHDQTETRIGQEGTASGSGFRIAIVNRDDHFKVAERLSLQAIKTFGD